MKKINYKPDILNVIKELNNKYPSQLLSTHLAMALAEYPNFDGLSDKEFYFILEKYRCTKELDIAIPHSENVDDILMENFDIADVFEEEDDF